MNQIAVAAVLLAAALAVPAGAQGTSQITKAEADLAALWDSLDCHPVFGVDECVRWLLR